MLRCRRSLAEPGATVSFQALRGTADLLAEELTRFVRVERAARSLAARYGYQEIRTPVIEEAGLFLRSVGETSDIVQKEMFRFEDRGGHDIALRPEGTASVVRAYLQHNLHKTQGLAKLFYLGPMFRAERPQAGRQRQFHQYGVEAIGSGSAWLDVEAISLSVDILADCGVRQTALWLSTMGCRDDQRRSAERIREFLRPKREALCNECQGRFDRNVYRVFDCKHPGCRAIVEPYLQQVARRPGFPPMLVQLCDACAAHFDMVREGLRASGIPFDDTQLFARGLDYYTRTVFEVKAQGLGAQDTVAAGGRYDHLVEELGGPAMGAVGFAAGIERVLMARQAQAATGDEARVREGLYIALAQPDLARDALRLAREARQRGVVAMLDYDGRSLKAQLREADKLQCRWVAILGATELQQGTIAVKDLEQGTQQPVPLARFAEEMGRHAQAANGAHTS